MRFSNEESKKMKRTIYHGDYNCGGYALNTFDWYRPYENEFEEYFATDRKGMQRYVDHMLEEFSGSLRVINSLKELRENEYAIAFRTRKTDFHYCKRAKSGHWTHKPGWAPIRKILKAEVFGKEWPRGYNSPIILFAATE